MDDKKIIICMKWGTKFGPEYVNRLYKMVEKNLTLPHRFVCLTDNSDGIMDGVEIFPIPDNVPVDENAPERGWKKLSIFAEKLYDLSGQALFLDLDIVIRDNIDCFFDGSDKFLIIKDWDFPNDIIGNSSVFRFNIGKHSYVLKEFIKNKAEIQKRHRNEQAYLSYAINAHGALKYWPKQWCVSFKRNCLHMWPMCYFKMPIDPKKAKIIVFHGKPNPEQAYNGYVGKCGFRFVKATKWLDLYWERN